MSRSIYEEITRDWSEEKREQFPSSAFQFHSSVGSTNTLLRENLESGEADHFSLVVADHQTAGRGRRGDRWEASEGSNLLFSLALQLPDSPRNWSRLPHLTAMVVGMSIESILTESPQVEAKWPNDLMAQSRKLCGILVETITTPSPFAIVGVGINVNMRGAEFPTELADIATSLYEMEGCEANRWFLLGLILESFLENFPDRLTDFESVLAWYRNRDFLAGKSIEVLTVTDSLKGVAKGLGADGELIVETPEKGEVAIVSAEKIVVC